MVPSWVHDAIWWQVYPLGFTGAPIRTTHDTASRFTHLENWLDHAVTLGVSGLILGPIFESETHGYDTVDFWRIDGRLGSEADFLSFLTACRKRGLHVVLDGVFNHVGRNHPWVLDVEEHGKDSEFADLILWSESTSGPVFTPFEGHDSLVTLNHSDERVVSLVTDVMCHWLDLGASGWRLDAAYAVQDSFWAEVLPRVRQLHPEAWFVGEVIHGDYAEIAAATTMDSLTQYELWKALWSSLVDRNYYELASALERHNIFLRSELPLTFIGNHDVTRIASLAGTGGAALALTVLLTVGGTPCIYYGDELNYLGVKEERIGGDDDVRPVMPSSPDQLSSLGEGTYRLHQELIGLRRRHAWLVEASTSVEHLENEALTYLSVGKDPSQWIRVSVSVRGGYHAEVTSSSGEQLFHFSSSE